MSEDIESEEIESTEITGDYHKGSKPGRRTKSDDEYDARVEYTAFRLSHLITKSALKKDLKNKYGCSARMCENYIARARKKILEWSGTTKQQARDQVVATLQGMFRQNLKPMELLAMLDRFTSLFALNEAQKHEITGKDGAPLAVQILETVVDSSGESSEAGGSETPPGASEIPQE